jgi:hypothetical protein
VLIASAARRAATVAALTLAVIVGAGLPASATFADAAIVSTSVTTMTVAAPSSVSVNDTCWGIHYSGTFTWPASTTPFGVTGYRVTAYLNDGTTSVLGTTDAATRTLTVTSDTSSLTYQPRIAVTTLTSYGWTAESAKSAVLTC